MYAVLFVLDNPDLLDKVLDAWNAIGISGATILESSGIHRRRIMRQNIPTRYAFPERAYVEGGSMTLYTVVASEAMVHACLQAVEKITGSLDLPGTGIFTAWPLMISRGVPPEAE
jgi:nitrogen regulatory protein PII